MFVVPALYCRGRAIPPLLCSRLYLRPFQLAPVSSLLPSPTPQTRHRPSDPTAGEYWTPCATTKSQFPSGYLAATFDLSLPYGGTATSSKTYPSLLALVLLFQKLADRQFTSRIGCSLKLYVQAVPGKTTIVVWKRRLPFTGHRYLHSSCGLHI